MTTFNVYTPPAYWGTLPVGRYYLLLVYQDDLTPGNYNPKGWNANCSIGSPVEFLAQTTVVPLAGDANSDGSVNGTDLNTVLSNYGMTSGATWAMGDFNGDGTVNGTDLNIVLSNYGSSFAGVTAAVPEPSTLLLAATGLLGLLAYAWRKNR